MVIFLDMPRPENHMIFKDSIGATNKTLRSASSHFEKYFEGVAMSLPLGRYNIDIIKLLVQVGLALPCIRNPEKCRIIFSMTVFRGEAEMECLRLCIMRTVEQRGTGFAQISAASAAAALIAKLMLLLLLLRTPTLQHFPPPPFPAQPSPAAFFLESLLRSSGPCSSTAAPPPPDSLPDGDSAMTALGLSFADQPAAILSCGKQQPHSGGSHARESGDILPLPPASARPTEFAMLAGRRRRRPDPHASHGRPEPCGGWGSGGREPAEDLRTTSDQPERGPCKFFGPFLAATFL